MDYLSKKLNLEDLKKGLRKTINSMQLNEVYDFSENPNKEDLIKLIKILIDSGEDLELNSLCSDDFPNKPKEYERFRKLY